MEKPRFRTAGLRLSCHMVIAFLILGTVLTRGSTHEIAPAKRTLVDRNIGPRITDVEVDTMRIHATNGPGRETIVSVTDWADPAKPSMKLGPKSGDKRGQQPTIDRLGIPLVGRSYKQLADERDRSQKTNEASEAMALLSMLKDLGVLDQQYRDKDAAQLQTSRACKSCKSKDRRAIDRSVKNHLLQNKSTSKNRVKRFLDLFSGSSGFQTVDVLAELQGHLSDPFSHDGGSGIGGRHGGGFGGGSGYGAGDDFGGHGPYSSGHREPSINGRDHGYDPGESFIDALSDGRDYGHGFTNHDIFRGIVDGPHGHGGHHGGGVGGGGGGGVGGGNHDFGGGHGGQSLGHGGFFHGKQGGGYGASGNNIFGFAMNDYTPSGVFFGVSDATNGDAVDTDILPVKVKHPRIRTAKKSPKTNLKKLLARALRALKGKTVAKSNQSNSASSITRSQKIRLLKVVRELLRRIKARQAKGRRISGVSSRLPSVVVTDSPLQDYAGSHRRKRSVDNAEKVQSKGEKLQPQDDGYSVAYNPTSSLQDSTGYFYQQASVPEQPYTVDTTQQLVPLDTNSYASAFGDGGIPANSLLYESPTAKGYHGGGLHDTSNAGYISLANVGASHQTSAGFGGQSQTAPDLSHSLNSNAGYEVYSSPSVGAQGKTLETPNANYGMPSTNNFYDHRSAPTGSYDNNLVYEPSLEPGSGNGYRNTAGNQQGKADSSYANSPLDKFYSPVKDAAKESLREDPLDAAYVYDRYYQPDGSYSGAVGARDKFYSPVKDAAKESLREDPLDAAYVYDRYYQPDGSYSGAVGARDKFYSPVKDAAKESLREDPLDAAYVYDRYYQPDGSYSGAVGARDKFYSPVKDAAKESLRENPLDAAYVYDRYYQPDGSYSGAVGTAGSPTPTSKSPASQHGKESYGHNIGYGYGHDDGYGHGGGYGHDSGYGGGGYGHSSGYGHNDGYGHGSSGGYGHGSGSGGYGHGGGGGYGHGGGYGKDKGKGKVKKWDKGYYGKGNGKWGQKGDHHSYHQGEKNGKWKTDLHDHYNTKGTKIKTYNYGGQGWYKENSHGQNQGYGASNGDTYGKFDGGHKGKSQEYKHPYHNYNSQSSGYQREHGYYKK